MPKEIRLSGVVGDDLNAEYVQNLLSDLNEDIIVNLYTPGGYVYEGMEIYNIISRYSRNKSLVMGGLVASIGSVIAMAFDKISVTESSVFMIHNAWDVIVGDKNDLKIAAEKLEKINNQIADILSKKSGKTVDEILTMMDKKDGTWLFGKEIVDAGFADKIIKAKDSGSGNENKSVTMELAKQKVQNTIAALHTKDKTAFTAGNGNENTNQRGESMSKKEMLDKLRTMKENGELALSELAGSFEFEIVTDAHTSALNIVSALKEMNVTDPVAYIKKLQGEISANAEAVRNAKLSEVFGVSEKDADGKEKNLVLLHAMDKVGDKSGEELDAAIEALKTDPVMEQLRKDKADPHSGQNKLGIVEKSNNGQGQGEQSGVKAVIL